MKLYYQIVKNDYGEFIIVVSNKGLISLSYQDMDLRLKKDDNKIIKNNKYTTWFAQQLKDYFDKKIDIFTIPLDYTLLHTEFSLKLSKEVTHIPYGTLQTYKHLAVNLDSPSSYSVIGQILLKNPHLIVVPSHRVINSNGNIGSYIENKEADSLKVQLLKLEGSLLDI